jgi:hypothetical protein
MKTEDLEREISALKTRLNESDLVIASLQAWIQYSFGNILVHTSNPDDHDLTQCVSNVQTAFEDMWDRLGKGLRGIEGVTESKDGFDRLLAAGQETTRWMKSGDDHCAATAKNDAVALKLLDVGLDMLKRLDPVVVGVHPLESEAEMRARRQATQHLDQFRSRTSALHRRSKGS